MRRLLLWLGGVCFILFLAGISFSIIFNPGTDDPIVTSVEQTPPSETPPAKPVIAPDTASTNPGDTTATVSTSHDRPQVAIVIDDLGWDPRTAKYYDELELSLTMALLPQRPRSQSFYERWKDQFEFIIHMPMEPEGFPHDDPGEGALMTSMGREEIRDHLQSVFETYPRAVGMNNHMGSAFTADRERMSHVMEFLSEKDLYYFDSGTSANSKALEMANRWNVPVIKNQVFLDNKRDRESIRQQLEKLVERARDRGSSVGIGHIQSVKTAEVLAGQLPRLQEKGIEFVPLSEIVGLPRLHARNP